MKCTNNYSGVVVLPTHPMWARHLRDGQSSGELCGGQRRTICDNDQAVEKRIAGNS